VSSRRKAPALPAEVTLVSQANGDVAVNRGDSALGIVGRDHKGWWASHSYTEQPRGGGFVGSFFYVSGLRTRNAAVAALVQWHGDTAPIAKIGGPRS
jgi:hypothetical protein